MNAKHSYKILRTKISEFQFRTDWMPKNPDVVDKTTIIAARCGLSRLRYEDQDWEYIGYFGLADWHYEIEVEVTRAIHGITRKFDLLYMTELRAVIGGKEKDWQGYEIYRFAEGTYPNDTTIDRLTCSDTITKELYMMASQQAKQSLLDRLNMFNEKLDESISKEIDNKEIDKMRKIKKVIKEQAINLVGI